MLNAKPILSVQLLFLLFFLIVTSGPLNFSVIQIKSFPKDLIRPFPQKHSTEMSRITSAVCWVKDKHPCQNRIPGQNHRSLSTLPSHTLLPRLEIARKCVLFTWKLAWELHWCSSSPGWRGDVIKNAAIIHSFPPSSSMTFWPLA